MFAHTHTGRLDSCKARRRRSRRLGLVWGDRVPLPPFSPGTLGGMRHRMGAGACQASRACRRHPAFMGHHDKGDSRAIPTSHPFSLWLESVIQLQREQRAGIGKSVHSSPLRVDVKQQGAGVGLNPSLCQEHQQRHSTFLGLLTCIVSVSLLFNRHACLQTDK